MKRAIGLILLIAAVIVGFLSVRGAMPFLPVFGTSMEPELHAGDLIMVNPVSTSDVEEGDIIVFSIPKLVRESYNYPAIVAHRVLKIYDDDGTIRFRTKGDNTGEDPFVVRPQDLRGTVGKRIPVLGFPILFLQSQQGLIFIVVALILLSIYLYSDELGRGRSRLQRGVFAPVLEENRQGRRVLEHRMESAEKGVLGTQEALHSFASAIAEYAEHLKSHTSAIQSLSEASHELKRGAAEQNKILGRLAEVIGQSGDGAEKRPELHDGVYEVLRRGEEMEREVKELKRKLDGVEKEEAEGSQAGEIVHKIVPQVEEIVRDTQGTTFPPGCFRSRSKPAGEGETYKAS